jgi:Gpi18-like mannosyltransferase
MRLSLQMASFFSYLGTPIFLKIFPIPLGFTLWFIVRNCDMIFSKLKTTGS